MSGDVEELLAAHDDQLRRRVPLWPPLGAVVEQDGTLVRHHYGTHGTVDYRDVPGADFAEVVGRQQAAFAARAEPVEWQVFDHDPPEVAAGLRDAGFTPGRARPVLVGVIDEVASRVAEAAAALPQWQQVRPLGYGEHRNLARIREMERGSAPHRRPLAEIEADGRFQHWHRLLLVHDIDGRTRAAGWAEFVAGTQFVSVGGMTAPHPAFVAAWARWAGDRRRGSSEPQYRQHWRYFVAEADGELLDEFLRWGFHQVTGVRSFHWTPPGAPLAIRPVCLVFDDPDADAVWARFAEQWEFPYAPQVYPGLREPEASVTWQLDAIDGDDGRIAELQLIVERGLRAATRPGERVYYLHPFTQGYHFDPHRAGGPGRPDIPRHAYPDHGDFRLYTTADLRTGTLGHPWELSLCVFGEQLLAEVEDDLTALLGTVLRRGGRPVGNVWSFGPGW